MKIEKFDESRNYTVVINEDNEVGAGHGLYIVNTGDFDINVEDERIYLEAIFNAIKNEDKYGYGGENCDVMLHDIMQRRGTKVKEVKLPCNVDNAIYIFCVNF